MLCHDASHEKIQKGLLTSEKSAEVCGVFRQNTSDSLSNWGFVVIQSRKSLPSYPDRLRSIALSILQGVSGDVGGKVFFGQ